MDATILMCNEPYCVGGRGKGCSLQDEEKDHGGPEQPGSRHCQCLNSLVKVKQPSMPVLSSLANVTQP